MSNWHVFRCGSNQEAKAAAALEQHGIQSLYMFQTEEVRRRIPGANRTRTEAIDRPMLVSYAFAQSPNEAYLRWQVRQIERVNWDGKCQPIRPLIYLGRLIGESITKFDALRALSGSRVEIPKPHDLAAGERAKFKAGPFADLAPIKIEVVTKNRARITIGSMPTWVDKEDLEYVPESKMEKAA